MKIKLLTVLFALSLMTMPSFAADKGTAKIGSISIKSVSNDEGASIAASTVGSLLLVTLGGSIGLSSGVISFYLPNTEFTKGQEFDLTSEANDTSDSAVINFLVQKTQIKGTSAVITSYSTSGDSVGSGKLKIISYDPDSKELKFNVTGKVAPYIRSINLAAKDIDKPIAVTANISVTLP